MKNIIYSLIRISLLIGLSGCEKDVETWHGEDGVYFYVQWGVDWYDTTYWAAQPYTKIEFVKQGTSETTVKMRVMATGPHKNYDRHFRIVVDQDSTSAVENENYLPIEEYQTLRAGTHFTDVYVTVKNSKALTDEERRLVFRLLPTEDLSLACPVWEDFNDMLANDAGLDEFDGTRHTIILNDFITRPTVWPGPTTVTTGTQELGLFGIFSKEKYEEILKEFPELTYEDFMSTATMPTSKQRVISNKMANKLQSLYDAGTPILENDGRLMWFLGVSWNSFYGIPYVPSN